MKSVAFGDTENISAPSGNAENSQEISLEIPKNFKKFSEIPWVKGIFSKIPLPMDFWREISFWTKFGSKFGSIWKRFQKSLLWQFLALRIFSVYVERAVKVTADM